MQKGVCVCVCVCGDSALPLNWTRKNIILYVLNIILYVVSQFLLAHKSSQI